MATAAAAPAGKKELTFAWEGKDKQGKTVRGEFHSDSAKEYKALNA